MEAVDGSLQKGRAKGAAQVWTKMLHCKCKVLNLGKKGSRSVQLIRASEQPHTEGLDSYELGSWTERTLGDITKLSRGFWWNTKTMEAV